jgi:hypothetical protein
MLLWQYVLAADNQLDLSDPATGDAWLAEQPWGLKAVTAEGGRLPFSPPWDQGQKQEWRACVLALRSVVKRLNGYRVRRPVASGRHEQKRADSLFAHYLGLLKLVPTAAPRRRGPRRPLARATFLGLRAVPTAERGVQPVRRVTLRNPTEWLHEPEVFWQCVFYSCVSSSIDPVCETCGKPFGPTPTGRHSRARVCQRCKWNQWKERQPKTELRKRWALDKRKQRW